ncbi:unnamed protein product [Callosobruchus maculatus]|uniref:Carboxylic ester hydrolase n=1 Tax=Callosobruchus maculatus TaxID=64391 RepID=A0A653DGG8_CALMS|nr:unnamed protein product [Callosobruchus maculatus]
MLIKIIAVVWSLTFLQVLASPSSDQPGDDPGLYVTLNEPKNSTIKGSLLTSFLGRYYYAFRDVPYAMPPVGKRRFKNAKNTTKRLPVFFWIHGGGFVIGSGGYDRQNPYYFMDEEIVVVTINYRLGILGFLSTEDSVIPANLGLRDQWLALEWTRANIDRFGGDFENIVIGGESAGAASVGYHVLGIEQKQIFSGAFMASGTCMSTWAYQEKPKERALKVARKLDKHFDSTDSASILALLQNVTSESLLGNCSEEQSYVDWVSVLPNDKYGYRPPTDAIDTQVFLLVPILLGFNSEESLCPLSTGNTTGDFWKRAKELDDDPSQILGVLKVGQQNATQLGIELRKLYTNGLFVDDIPALVRYMSDYRFVTATTKHARMASHFVPTYLYEFSFKSSTAQNSTVPGINGTCHAEDLRFYWKNAFFPIPEKEWIVTRKFVRIISNFVKYKRPMPIPDRGDPDPLFENATWPGVRPNDIVYMNFGEHFKLERNPRNFSTIEAFLDKHLVQPIYVY